MNKEQLQAIRERVNRATPGPWSIHREDVGDDVVFYVPTMIKSEKRTIVDSDGGLISWSEPCTSEQVEADAEFIAHAREDVPALLNEVERLEEENRRFREALEEISKEDSLYFAVKARQALKGGDSK
ncbi:hypothetical protein DNHGIG_14910 [Collibacillus ludicampi]|uniref:Uncharacterized protein n=1 Tax=Collibacillus ludicampi TaxID=2771369 RepID=A0AAV4LER8_9BACL|nr:ead/Ea22-like family protein [Collibacillus ludicampi]GIM45942.1 hypothetical protein DNHGIG_14910 [Collibacillus ludicampi]